MRSLYHRLRAELKDTLELVLLPGLAAVLPWPVAYRVFRWASRFPALYRERWQPALERSAEHGWVADATIWARHARIVAMVDHADLWLVLTRSNRWLDKHADRVGGWPSPGGSFIGYTFHWGCGFWALRDLAAQGVCAHPLVASLPPAGTPGRAVLTWYARLRNRTVAKTLGTGTIDVGRELRKVVAALKRNEAVLAAIDVPPGDAASERVAFLDGQIEVPRAMYRLAVERRLPALVFLCALDFANGRRRVEVHPLGTPDDVAVLAQDVFTLLDERVRQAPDAWHFWGSFDYFRPQRVPAPQAEPGGERVAAPARPLDVIVPVYRNLALTQRCVASVLSAPVSVPFRLVVVADDPPEPELRAWCEALAQDERHCVVFNERNLGFVVSVNRALAMGADRDVVLLNSDAEVSGDWLGRLWRCVQAERVGTVTPFSNDATICSYPWAGWTGGVPGSLGLSALDALFAGELAGECAEIPVGVGFCMLVRRACLDEVGVLDEASFGRGYGEEVDFCLRARAQGWRHLLCADVFVAHAGAASFGADKQALAAQAGRLLAARYPNYEAQVDAFVRADPLRPMRLRVDAARLRAGGVAEATCLLAERAAERDYLKAWLDDVRAAQAVATAD